MCDPASQSCEAAFPGEPVRAASSLFSLQAHGSSGAGSHGLLRGMGREGRKRRGDKRKREKGKGRGQWRRRRRAKNVGRIASTNAASRNARASLYPRPRDGQTSGDAEQDKVLKRSSEMTTRARQRKTGRPGSRSEKDEGEIDGRRGEVQLKRKSKLRGQNH